MNLACAAISHSRLVNNRKLMHKLHNSNPLVLSSCQHLRRAVEPLGHKPARPMLNPMDFSPPITHAEPRLSDIKHQQMNRYRQPRHVNNRRSGHSLYLPTLTIHCFQLVLVWNSVKHQSHVHTTLHSIPWARNDPMTPTRSPEPV